MDTQPFKLPPPTEPERSGISMGKLAIVSLTALVALFIIVAGLTKMATPVVVEPEPTPLPTPTEVEEAPAVEPEEEVATVEEPWLYADCGEVWAALERPIFIEDEGFQPSWDWDNDQIACEDNPLTVEDEAEINWGSVRERFKNNLDGLAEWSKPHLEELWGETKSFADTARDFFNR